MSAGYSLDEGEVIIQKVYRHWINLGPVVVGVGALLIAVLGLTYAVGRFSDLAPGMSLSVVILPLLIIFSLLALVIGVAGYYVYRQNYLLLTNMHLILVEQHGLFNRQVSQQSLSRVQDVQGGRRGFFPTIFNFGNLEVQTAGETSEFIFLVCPDPVQLADQCLQAHEEYMKKFEENGQVKPE